MTRVFLFMAALLAVLASCVRPPALDRLPPLSSGPLLPERQVAAKAEPALPTAAALQGGALDRLTLRQALEFADRAHPELAAAQAQVRAAEGRALQVSLFPNPELVARTESVPVTGSIIERAEYIVGISQPLPLGRRLAIARQAETLDRDRFLHDWANKRRVVRVRVQSAFAATLYRQRVIQERAEDVRIAENGVAVARARLSAGDAIPAEVGQAEVELGRARLELENATSMYTQAVEALATAMGEPTMEVKALEGSLEEPLALPSFESLIARLAQSPVVASAEADIATQRARLELVKAQQTPDVTFDLSYRRVGDVENTVDVGVRLPIPLFNRYQGRIREIREDMMGAEARARAIRNELALELQTAYRTLARAVAAVKLLREEILPRAERVLQNAEARYASGDTSLAELLPIRRDWTRARLDYLEALSEVMQAWATLSSYVP